MVCIDYKKLSPIGTDEFPCFGARYQYKSYADNQAPHWYALKVGIIKTEKQLDMLVKIPISDEQKELANKLIQKLNTCYPASVRFVNLQICRYDFGNQICFSGFADTFIIMED